MLTSEMWSEERNVVRKFELLNILIFEFELILLSLPLSDSKQLESTLERVDLSINNLSNLASALQ